MSSKRHISDSILVINNWHDIKYVTMSNGAILYMCDLGIISFDAVAAIIKLTLLSPSYSTSEDIF